MSISIKDMQNWLLEKAEFEVACKEGNVLARVNIDFGVFKVKGFTVRSNEGKLYVKPPAVPPRWHVIFYTDNKEFWEQLCQKILAKYDEQTITGAIEAIDKNYKPPFENQEQVQEF